MSKDFYYDILNKKEDDQMEGQDFMIYINILYYENKFPFDKTEMFKMLESRNKNKNINTI